MTAVIAEKRPRRPVPNPKSNPNHVRLMHEVNAIRKHADQADPLRRHGPFLQKCRDADDAQEAAGAGPQIRENVRRRSRIKIGRDEIQRKAEDEAHSA